MALNADRFLFTARKFVARNGGWHKVDEFQTWTTRGEAYRKAAAYLKAGDWTVTIQELDAENKMVVLMDRQG
jgi:hypothetical protein